METIKDKLPMTIAIIVAIAICSVAYYFIENYETVYYTQVDNSKVEKIDSTDDMKYEYTLKSYNSDGNEKEMKFKTSRELREKAYLKLEVRTFGVHSWEEVQEGELPQRAYEKLKK